VCIGVITYRRPEGVARLVGSIARLEGVGAGTSIAPHVVIVDNDPSQSARGTMDQLDELPWPVDYVAEPTRGIPFARNAVIEHAIARGTEFVAFVDDDEVVEAGWLQALMNAQQDFDADAVAGPVLSRFVEQPPAWIVAGGFFERARHTTGTEIRYVATGNVLVRLKRIIDTRLRFDGSFALTGGEDTHFFLALGEAGANLRWCDEAIVHEYVPASRMQMPWLLKRAYRAGNSLARSEIALHKYPPRRPSRRMVKAAAQVLIGTTIALPAAVLGTARFIQSLQLAARGLGALTGLMGVAYEEYRTIHGT
jgi:succinoglycan biosynthesis protein ExoM